MAERVVLRVLITWLAVVVILGTTSAYDPHESPVGKLIDAIKHRTISTDDGPEDAGAFENFVRFIKQSFPALHSSLHVSLDVVNQYSLLYYVNGSNSSLAPYLLSAHYDVVPADPTNWKYPPFLGYFTGDFVHGRGTLKDKSRLIAILESVETLLSGGFKPKRSFFIAIGHDEEAQGRGGAKEMARLIKKRVQKLKFILNEGTPIIEKFSSLVTKPVAIIGVAEKGYSKIRVTIEDRPGQSSMPSSNPSIVAIAETIARLSAIPHPITLDSGLERAMVDAVAHEFLPCFDQILADKDLYTPSLSLIADQFPFLNAMLRTTTTFTMVQGGNESNIIPRLSTAVIYHSIYPKDTVKSVLKHDHMVINDGNIIYEIVDQSDPSPISPYGFEAYGFWMIRGSILASYPGAIVTPGLAVGGTSTRWYRELSDQVYHVSPFLLNLEDMKTIHGDNEKISVLNLSKLIDIYSNLIWDVDQYDRLT